ncbi:m-phase inducer phosphatase [Paramecium bursaria]
MNSQNSITLLDFFKNCKLSSSSSVDDFGGSESENLNSGESFNRIEEVTTIGSKLSFEKLFNSQSPNTKKLIVENEGLFLKKKAVSVSSEATSPDIKYQQSSMLPLLTPSLIKLNPFQNVKAESQNEPLKFDSIEREGVRFVDPQIIANYKEDDIQILDCRYQFEYQGGHIQNALNLNNPLEIQEYLFQNEQTKKIIVLYCEFSIRRSVRIYKYIRNQDRQINEYPLLIYPNLYVIDKGYANFYKNYNDLCDGSYTLMTDISQESNFLKQQAENEKSWELQRKLKKQTITI